MEDNPQEILDMKLANPNRELSPTQRISLVNHCATLGQQNAAATTDREAVTILGETGTGKSTSINHWMGCRMELRTLEELEEMGIEGETEDVIVVHPDSERPGVASIGHGDGSHTFMPQIIRDPNRATRVYIDCPGFSDNRGAEINIANAMNTKHALRQASGVKAVFLASYPELIVSRGRCIRNLEHMCQQLFGGLDNLRNHQNSVLLGMNRTPLQATLNRIRTKLTRGDSPTMQILARRLFLYDPLERGGEDFWSREQFLAEIERMPSISQRVARNLFQTVLTDGDKVMLQRIVRHQVEAMNNALEQSDYPAADRCWNLLNQLRIIEHREIEELMDRQVRPHMRAYAQERTSAFNRHAAQHDFTGAERLLGLLRSLQAHFPDENLVDLESLEATLQTTRAQYTAQQEAEEATQRAEEATQRAEEATQRAKEATQRAEEERDRERRAREEMGQRVNNLERALEAERERKNLEIWGAVITGAANVIGKAIERKD
jgi:energy-coupling factor transporter ATP-binding protein EcfA2